MRITRSLSSNADLADGWFVYETSDPAIRIQVKADEVAGRRVLSGFLVEREGGAIDAQLLRSLPLVDIEHQLNSKLIRGALTYRDRKAGLKIKTPVGQRTYPDEFYERVASIYSMLIARREHPAPAIAEANGIPVSTVHRWIKESRQRGILPPGRKGRAG